MLPQWLEFPEVLSQIDMHVLSSLTECALALQNNFCGVLSTLSDLFRLGNFPLISLIVTPINLPHSRTDELQKKTKLYPNLWQANL